MISIDGQLNRLSESLRLAAVTVYCFICQRWPLSSGQRRVLFRVSDKFAHAYHAMVEVRTNHDGDNDIEEI